MAAGAAVLWDTCDEASCNGVRIGPDGPCLAHASVEELAEHLAGGDGDVDLDGRGVRFSRGSWARVLDALPADEEGRRRLGTVQLDQARFDHEVSFDEITFTGPLSVVGAVFRSDARFAQATFAAPADFSESVFEVQAWFVEAFFDAPVSFRGARFDGAAFFQRVSFAAAASFDEAVFAAAVTISRATFYDASFRGTVFGGHAHFDGSTCTTGWRLDGARFRMEGEGPELPAGAIPVESGVEDPALLPEVRPPKKAKGDGLLRRVAGRVALGLLAVAFLATLLFVVARPEQKSEGFKDFAFLHVNERTGKPTRFNPCEPVRYMVNLAGAPRGAEQALEQAFAEISRATGMTFVNEGSTDETVQLNLPAREEQILPPPERTDDFARNYREVFSRPSYQPDRYGDRWAPVLIAWSAFEELGVEYSRTILGVGGSDPRDANEDGTSTAYVSGVAVMNTSAAFLDLKATLMHELGHVVGLAHAGSSDQLMFPSDRDVDELGEGDLEGLRLLGRGAGCVRVPQPG